MYYREIESEKDASARYNDNLKKAAAHRLARNASWNKANKPKEKK